ncbi:hypothetical protein [Thalassospira lohafexi]|uniref:Uncharacterized protein n=1 Tax=Thalassospira lohafexi TaxID=744227 RepID=A0A2N3L6S9_9PROT|nr:hypothetical protein [Thalassospira lohafexi]PKR58534.1 hypothetical protein COO92_12470 [Thalassospira lohafexi]
MNSPLSSSRPVVLVDTFSFHTFINSGYFYCWHLSEIYDVVLLVAPNDEQSPPIKALCATQRIKRVIVLPERSCRWAIHAWFVRRLPALLNELQPTIVLMNNWHSFHQKYLSRVVRRFSPLARIIVCLSVHAPVTDFAVTDYRLREASLVKWRERWWWMPGPLANLFYHLWGRWLGWRDFLILPLLLSGFPLRETHNPWRGKLISKDTGNLFDAVLCYAPYEQDAYLMEMEERHKIHLVQHPMTLSADGVEVLFPTENVESPTVVLPSCCLDYNVPESTEQQISRLEAIWGQALEIIQRRTGGKIIWWKLHPGFVDDPTMLGLTQRLEERFPNFVSMTGKMTAEAMIVSASLVVGDVSTVLQWASRFGRCRTLSLDIFGVEGGDEMGAIPDLTVIRSFADLEEVDLQAHKKNDQDYALSYPTPIEFLESIERE